MGTFKIKHFQNYYNDSKLAKEDTMRGNIWGFIQFNKNFTNMIDVRFDDPMVMSSNDINESTVQISLDMSGNF